jgi:2-polyprenyl-3-methyl-5-hydroxy-6-metoxy-1,4-benzoquinol methylase
MTQRNFDEESKDNKERNYFYNFDYDVMHPFMLKSFRNFFLPGNVLELGCFEGAFTQRLSKFFGDIVAVEASPEAAEKAQLKLGSSALIINDTFEQVTLNKKFNNVILTHVLEHLDDPVGLLRRINEEWLAPGGRLFLVCPNANAASRQLAVKMGLISHNSAVTQAESVHGHRCTYSLDTLERDAKAAGFHIAHRSGIFFKALANFQWDRLLQTDIVSPAYVEACYDLGLSYPDLCASIFLLCEHPAVNVE